MILINVIGSRFSGHVLIAKALAVKLAGAFYCGRHERAFMPNESKKIFFQIGTNLTNVGARNFINVPAAYEKVIHLYIASNKLTEVIEPGPIPPENSITIHGVTSCTGEVEKENIIKITDKIIHDIKQKR